MEGQKQIPLFPLCGWDLAPILGQQALIIRLDYLSSESQKLEDANHGLRHVLTPRQARELAAALERVAARAESGGSQPPPGPTR